MVMSMVRRLQHPYPKRLLFAAPVPHPDQQQRRREEQRRGLAEQANAEVAA